MKNWSKFYDYSFRKQFIKDLSTIKNINDIKWFFNSTSGINDISELKTMVKNALKKADGTPIDELEKLFKGNMANKNITKFKILFGEKIINSENLINTICKDKNFNKIFKIVK